MTGDGLGKFRSAVEHDEEEDDMLSNILLLSALAGFLLPLLLGLLVSRVKRGKPLSGFYTRPLCWGVTPFALILFVWEIACMGLATAAAMAGEATDKHLMKGLGAASSLAAAASMGFLGKHGVHTAFGVSLELAYHVHAFFGTACLLVGAAHGIAAIAVEGIEKNLRQTRLLVGLIGTVLMLIGVLPGLLHKVAPRCMRYDAFKMLHSFSAVGYLFIILHVLLLAVDKGHLPAMVALALNGVALVVFCMQRMHALVSTRRVTLVRSEVVSDPVSTHLDMDLRAPGFRFQPGQWVRLHIPSLGMVGHPLTIVPTDSDEVLRFIVKPFGAFTTAMMSADLTGKAIRVEGPYGHPGVAPALPWASAVAFIVGGVGATTALALAPAVKAAGLPVYLFWSLRSPSLFRHCSRVFAPCVEHDRSHCQITLGDAESARGGAGSLAVAPARKSIADWLGEVVPETERRARAKTARTGLFIFVCGPSSMAVEARAACRQLSKKHPDCALQVHGETFDFLAPST